VVLMGHTADDVAEARAMRAAGSTTPEPRAWGPSPAWPEGRGVFLLRPMLALRRAEIRAWLTARGEIWIDDPANEDLRSARARARKAGPGDLPAPSAAPLPEALAGACAMDAAGVLSLPRARLRAAAADEAAAFLGIACLCAAGTRRPPGAAQARALLARLAGEAPVTATLAGARIEADADGVRFLREAGEATRGGLGPMRLRAGETAVWDGRFEIAAHGDLAVRRLRGLAAQLSAHDRAALAGLPARARPSLPATEEGGRARLVQARPLALERLRAACGLVAREPD
jgi:tRNA(Ile)-lysidine synthase